MFDKIGESQSQKPAPSDDAEAARFPAVSRRRRVLFATMAVSLALAFSFLAAEIFIRSVVAGRVDLFHEKLRQPRTYASYHSDDAYWKLQARFDSKKRPTKVHPVLGWVNDVNPGTYRHYASEQVGERTPVLMYGDSFAECATKRCFEDILNKDPEFSRSHYLLNHGVGGYGVDQIALLYEKTIGLYDDPIVVFSLMTKDLDRSILSYRSMQKPYFVIKDGALELSGVPIDADQAKYLEENPPRIRSYLWRLLIHSNVLPVGLRHALTGRDDAIARKIELNRMILERVLSDLRARNVPFVVLVFHPHLKRKPMDGPGTWRDAFLRDFLEQQGVPYIWSKSVILRDAEGSGRKPAAYFFPGNNHPNGLGNRLIAREIKTSVLGLSGR